MLKNKPSDVGLTAVASNNLIAINKDQNIFDSKKRMKAATVEGLDQKLNSAQRSAIARNNALLAMFTAQVKQSRIYSVKINIPFFASLYLGIYYLRKSVYMCQSQDSCL